MDSSSRPKDDAKIADDCETVALGQKETTREESMSRLETELLKQKNVSLTHSLEEEEQSRQFRIQMAKLAAQGNMGLKRKAGDGRVVPEECGGKTEKYSWTQTETEIGIYVTLESFEVKGKDCKIEIKRRTLNVKVKDFIVFGEETKNNRLFADVNVDDSTWEIDSDEKLKAKALIVTLTKAKRTMANKHWRYVCENEPEIDVEKFGPPVVGVNERNPMDTELMREVFEQMKNPSDDWRILGSTRGRKYIIASFSKACWSGMCLTSTSTNTTKLTCTIIINYFFLCRFVDDDSVFHSKIFPP